MSLYGYANHSPMRFIDPDGREGCDSVLGCVGTGLWYGAYGVGYVGYTFVPGADAAHIARYGFSWFDREPETLEKRPDVPIKGLTERLFSTVQATTEISLAVATAGMSKAALDTAKTGTAVAAGFATESAAGSVLRSPARRSLFTRLADKAKSALRKLKGPSGTATPDAVPEFGVDLAKAEQIAGGKTAGFKSCPECTDLVDALVTPVAEGGVGMKGKGITFYPKGSQNALPVNPLYETKQWVGHKVVELPDGRILDPLKKTVFDSMDDYKKHVFTGEVISLPDP